MDSEKFKHMSILIIEDAPVLLKLARNLAQQFGFSEIYSTMNSSLGFDLFCKHKPDIVLLDWNMRPVNGIEITKLIRTDPRSPNPYVPVVMMTSHAEYDLVIEARDIGITEFLAKPYTANDLFKRLTRCIQNPRKFVTSDEYFGPDRRRNPEERSRYDALNKKEEHKKDESVTTEKESGFQIIFRDSENRVVDIDEIDH